MVALTMTANVLLQVGQSAPAADTHGAPFKRSSHKLKGVGEEKRVDWVNGGG